MNYHQILEHWKPWDGTNWARNILLILEGRTSSRLKAASGGEAASDQWWEMYFTYGSLGALRALPATGASAALGKGASAVAVEL